MERRGLLGLAQHSTQSTAEAPENVVSYAGDWS